jgi:hypothetical protein
MIKWRLSVSLLIRRINIPSGVGITGGFLLSASLFWNRSISSRAIFIRKVCARKSDGLDHERTKSTMQFLFFYWLE